MVSALYRVAVCEDEAILCANLCAQCESILDKLKVEHRITSFSSAEKLENALLAGEEFSLLCLDILMGGKSGMKLAQELRQRDDKTSILFITSSTEFLKDGYSVRPIQYLLKPVQAAELEQKILFIGRKRDAVVFPTNTNLFLEGCFGKAGFFRRLLHERNKYILYALEHLGLVR